MKILWKNYLYESVLMEAYKPEDIERLFGKNIEEYIKNNKNVYGDTEPVEVKLIKENIINEIVKADPSADKKYLGQITKWLLEKRPEDLETQIKEYLNRFKKILDIYPGGEVGGISKELSKGKLNLESFKNKVIELEKKFATNIENPDVKASKTSSNFKIIGQNETYVCFEVDRWLSEGDDEKHLCFSGDVDWCVKYKNYFDTYKPPYYYFMEKATGKEFALMHVGSSQLKNIRDEHLSYQDAEKIKDIIYPILKNYINNGGIIHYVEDFEVLMNLYGEDSEKYRELKIYLTTWFDYVDLGYLHRMKDLIDEYNFDIDIKDGMGRTALHLAIINQKPDPMYSNEKVVEWLIASGADVNAKTGQGTTPVYYACKYRNAEILKQLITAGADVNQVDNHGNSPMEYAVYDSQILQLMLRAGATIDMEHDLLGNAVRNDNIESAAILLKAGADPNKKDKNSISPMKFADMYHRLRIIEMFDHYKNTGEIKIPPRMAKGPSDEELARELNGL